MDVAEAAGEVFERLLVRLEQAQRLGEQVVEVERVVLFEVVAVGGVHPRDVADALLIGVLFGVLFRALAEHLGVGDVEFDVFELLFVLQPAFGERLLDDVGALRLAVDGEVFLEAAAVGELAQDAHAHAVNGAHPHGGSAVDHGGEALLHLVGGLVGEGDGEDGGGIDPLLLDEVGDARGQNARLAAARARQHEHGALGVRHRFDLLFVEFCKDFVDHRKKFRRARKSPLPEVVVCLYLLYHIRRRTASLLFARRGGKRRLCGAFSPAARPPPPLCPCPRRLVRGRRFRFPRPRRLVRGRRSFCPPFSRGPRTRTPCGSARAPSGTARTA